MAERIERAVVLGGQLVLEPDRVRAAPPADVGHVVLLPGIPERLADPVTVPDALGERVDDLLIADLLPVDAVGGDEAMVTAADRLVALRLGRPRVGIPEGHEIMGSRFGPDDVVVARAIELAGAERGPVPVDAVIALRAAGDLPPRTVGGRAAVVHPIALAVLEHRHVGASRPLPRRVERERRLAPLGRMELEIHPPHRFDQPVVDERLKPRADVRQVLAVWALAVPFRRIHIRPPVRRVRARSSRRITGGARQPPAVLPAQHRPC